MTPLLIQSTDTNVVVFLENLDGTAATGLTFSDITVGIKKESDSSFASFTLSGGNFTDLSNGFYEIALTLDDTDTLGSLYLSFRGATVKNTLLVARVAEVATASPQPTPGYTPQTTTIFGYIYNSIGVPKAGARVVARLVNQPRLIHPIDQGILINAELQITTTDATGFFSLDLVAGSTVEFQISEANYVRSVLIPTTSTNLFDIQ